MNTKKDNPEEVKEWGGLSLTDEWKEEWKELSFEQQKVAASLRALHIMIETVARVKGIEDEAKMDPVDLFGIAAIIEDIELSAKRAFLPPN